MHGRGANELDLEPLLSVLDPEARLVGVLPRGPLTLPPGGAHWYAVQQVGYPDPDTFFATFERTSTWLDAVLEELDVPPERTVLGGFSQGAVMSYALGLAASRPKPAAILAMSGFIPRVDGLRARPRVASRSTGLDLTWDERPGHRGPVGAGRTRPPHRGRSRRPLSRGSRRPYDHAAGHRPGGGGSRGSPPAGGYETAVSPGRGSSSPVSAAPTGTGRSGRR